MTPDWTGDGLEVLVELGDMVAELVGVGLRITSTQYELPILIPLQSFFTEGFFQISVRVCAVYET